MVSRHSCPSIVSTRSLIRLDERLQRRISAPACRDLAGPACSDRTSGRICRPRSQPRHPGYGGPPGAVVTAGVRICRYRGRRSTSSKSANLRRSDDSAAHRRFIEILRHQVRQDILRRWLPASLIAAATPSSCQDTIRPMATAATAKSRTACAKNLARKFAGKAGNMKTAKVRPFTLALTVARGPESDQRKCPPAKRGGKKVA